MNQNQKLGMALVSIGALSGCAASPDGVKGEGAGAAEVTEKILNGTAASSSDYPGVVAIYNQHWPTTAQPSICSGSLIRRDWILTARHCVTKDGNALGLVGDPWMMLVVRESNPGASAPANHSTGVMIVDDLRLTTGAPLPPDLALLKISPGFDGATTLWDGELPDLANRTIRVMGFGMNSLTGGAGALRRADVSVTKTFIENFNLEMNSNGQMFFHSDSGGPSLRLVDILGRSVQAVAGVHIQVGSTGATGLDTSVSAFRSVIQRKIFVPGSVDGPQSTVGGNLNGADIVLTGPAGWGSICVAWGFTHPNTLVAFGANCHPLADFPEWAASTNAKALTGDFNGDGFSDVALTGPLGWNTIPVAFSNENATFSVTNSPVTNIPALAATAGAKAVSGDYNGDGYDDIAVTGGSGWTNISVAFSTNNGTFLKKTCTVTGSSFTTFAAASGAKALAGDFDGDGRGDIALIGSPNWHSIPIAFSDGLDGTCSFTTTNESLASFPTWGAAATAQAVTGDFNRDGRDDIALMGGNWSTLPVALSKGDGSFTVVNNAPDNYNGGGSDTFPALAAVPNVKAVAGDFNGDRRDDIALVGVLGWGTIPVAVSKGDGTFYFVNPGVANFPGWAATANAVPASNHHGR